VSDVVYCPHQSIFLVPIGKLATASDGHQNGETSYRALPAVENLFVTAD